MSRSILTEKIVISHGKTIDYKATAYITPAKLDPLVKEMQETWDANSSSQPISYPGFITSLDDEDKFKAHMLVSRGYYFVDNPSAWRVKDGDTRKVIASSTVSVEKLINAAIRKLNLYDELIQRRRFFIQHTEEFDQARRECYRPGLYLRPNLRMYAVRDSLPRLDAYKKLVRVNHLDNMHPVLREMHAETDLEDELLD